MLSVTVTGPVAAHDSWSRWDGWTYRQDSTPGICTYVYAGQNHAEQSASVQVLREYNYAFYTIACQNSWTRPPHDIYLRMEYYANGVWPPCYETGFITNDFQSSFVFINPRIDLWFFGCNGPAPLTVYQDVFTYVWNPFKGNYSTGAKRPATQHDAYRW